jgi:hypothetical protein
MPDSAYEPVLSSKATGTFLGLSKSRQFELVRVLDQIAAFPSQLGDYCEEDPKTGREVQYLMVGDFVIGFWPDHPVSELRIVEIDEV